MSIKEIMERERWAREEAASKGNVNAWDEIRAPDMVAHIPPFPDIKGLEAYKQAILTMRQGFPDIRFEWEEMISEGNTIACRFTCRQKHTGESPMFPGAPTGKEIVIKGCMFYHVKNDKIVEEFSYTDWLGFYQQLGIVPPMG